jgi:hypothetical protein
MKDTIRASSSRRQLTFSSQERSFLITSFAGCEASLRHIERMMAERGVEVDHGSRHSSSWSPRILPVLAKGFRRRKHSVGGSWRLDETSINDAAGGRHRLGLKTPMLEILKDDASPKAMAVCGALDILWARLGRWPCHRCIVAIHRMNT